MTSNVAPAAGRALPGGALFALAIGLLLYLTTSLVLGSSGGSRVFDLSLSLPSVVMAPETQPNVSGDPISGSRLTPEVPIGRVMRAMPLAAFVAVVNQAISAPTTAAAARKSPAQPVRPTAVAPKRSHYHDADERSHRLARRR